MALHVIEVVPLQLMPAVPCPEALPLPPPPPLLPLVWAVLQDVDHAHMPFVVLFASTHAAYELLACQHADAFAGE